MIKRFLLFFVFIFIGCAGLPIGSVGPQGEPGPAGAKGPPGPKGTRGNDGKSVPLELIEKIENSLNSADNSESIVGSVAYSFGIAPRITGFIYLTSFGE